MDLLSHGANSELVFSSRAELPRSEDQLIGNRITIRSSKPTMAGSNADRVFSRFQESQNQSKLLPYYEVLEFTFKENPTQKDVIRRYRKLSLKYHPDKLPPEQREDTVAKSKFQKLNRAYTCLSDPEKRAKYDRWGFDEDNVQGSETDTANRDFDADTFVDAFFGEGARASDGRSFEWKLNAISNYHVLDVAEVPAYMKDIVKVGLNYMASIDLRRADGASFSNIYLLRHARVDILYMILGLVDDDELSQTAFDRDSSYPIT